MIKRITISKRKPGLSREEFIKHYEEVHAPLTLKHFPVLRHARNYIIVPVGAEEPEFDCISESWYADEKALQDIARILGGTSANQTVSAANAGYTTDIGKLFRDDTMSFTDGNFKSFLVDERLSTR